MTTPDSVTPPKKNSSGIYFVIAIIIAVVFLYFALRGIDWADFFAALGQTDFGILGIAFVIFSGSFFVRGMRWRVLLTAEHSVSALTAFWGTMIGYVGNNVLPARAGEVIRSVMISRKANISVSYVFATALTERIVDVPALVLVALLGILGLPSNVLPEEIKTTFRLFAVLGVVGVAIIFIAPRIEKWIKAVIEPILARLPIPGHVGEKLIKLLEEFLYGMRALQHPGRAATFAAFTAIIWFTEACVAILVARAMNLTFTLPVALILLAGLGFGSALPSAPGYVGITQLVCGLVLTSLTTDIKQPQAIAYSVVFEGITLFTALVWGGIGFWRMTIGSLPDVTAVAAQPEPAVNAQPD